MTDIISIVAAALAALGFSMPATATEPAVRGEQIQITAPPPPPEPVHVDDCAEARWHADQFGLPQSFDRIIWRESNCRQELGVRTSCCVGWLQLNADLHVRDHRLRDAYAACGVFGNADVDGPEPHEKRQHMCAAAQLHKLLGMQPWSL